ncbi:DUF2975 domain-containing protein [Thalassospira sp.]|uniref:DUF2975 domain-containing protein n=1 Tax=Thalassospira sp. TaxID=1912094 RepID=UPI0027341518|nr:DUF2975 domain-containing protein [Thalassospira sp.]MDP2697428.1 DUF2975 domain-containing protein [Thalassospira sp.]
MQTTLPPQLEAMIREKVYAMPHPHQDIPDKNTPTKIFKISRFFGWVCTLAASYNFLITPLIWYLPGPFGVLPSEIAKLAALTGWQRNATMIIIMIPSIIVTYGFWRLRAMFLAFGENRILDHKTITHLKVFCIALITQSLLAPIAKATGTAVIAIFTRPEETPFFSVAYREHEVSNLFLGILLLVIAWFFDEAIRVKAENGEERVKSVNSEIR